MDFKAELRGEELVVDPIIERKGNDVTIHVPSMRLIEDLKRELGGGDNGVRRIQSV